LQVDRLELLEAPVGARHAEDPASDEHLAGHRLFSEVRRDLAGLAEKLVLEVFAVGVVEA
jgi:hypothetical protein